MKYLPRSLAILVIATMISLTTSPSRAVTDVTASATDVSIVGDTCRSSQIVVAGDWDADVYNEITIDVSNPGGRHFAGRRFQDDYSGTVSMRVQLCKWNAAGRYRVDVMAEGFDEDFESTGSTSAVAIFHFTKKPKVNSTVLTGKRMYRPTKTYKYLVLGRLLRRHHGYRRQPIELQARINGDWTVIDTWHTVKGGRFGWEFKPNGFLWSYVYQGNRTTQWDPGINFRTPRRDRRSEAGLTKGVARSFVTRAERDS